MKNLVVLFLLFVILVIVESRFCSHTTKGICEVPDFGGWCFHDKSSGRFDCDDKEFCKNQTSLNGKTQIAGCFDLNGDFVCCCNKGHLCNTLLVDYAPQTNITQECTFSTDLPDQHTLIYRNCSEEWCFTFISSDKIGGATTIQKGCESRSLLKHVQNKAIDEEFKNNTEWHYSKPLYDSPRCNEIIAAAGMADANPFSRKDIRVCLDIEFVDNEIPSKGKICCCKGKNGCNSDDILWSDIAITMKEIENFRQKSSIEKEGDPSSSSTPMIQSISNGFLLLSILFLDFHF